MSILPQLILNSIIAGAIYTLITLGFNLIYGTTKFFNLAHGAVAAGGGYAAFYLIKFLGLNVYLAVILGVIFAGFIGWLTYELVFLPLRKRKASSVVLLVASIGILTLLQAILAILFTSQFQTLASDSQKQTLYNIFGGIITQTQVVILVCGLAIMFLLGLLLKKTNLGRAIRAISDDEEVARIIGINTNKIISYVFFIGSAIAGLAGILIGFDTGIEPTMGMSLLLKGAVASIIGGIGNVYGGVLGSFLLGFVENFGIWKLSGEWKDAIAFVLLIIFLIFRPKGIIKKD